MPDTNPQGRARMEDSHGRVTTAELFDAIGDLRTEMACAMKEMRDEQRENLNLAITRLELAISTIHTNFVSTEKFDSHEAATREKITAAVDASMADREKLWLAIHGVEAQLKWAAGVVTTAFLGVLIYIVQNHIR